jgi:hypothetical protein
MHAMYFYVRLISCDTTCSVIKDRHRLTLRAASYPALTGEGMVSLHCRLSLAFTFTFTSLHFFCSGTGTRTDSSPLERICVLQGDRSRSDSFHLTRPFTRASSQTTSTSRPYPCIYRISGLIHGDQTLVYIALTDIRKFSTHMAAIDHTG